MDKIKWTKGQITSTKHYTHKKDQVTRTPIRTGGELMCSGRVCSSCSTSGARRVTPVVSIQEYPLFSWQFFSSYCSDWIVCYEKKQWWSTNPPI